MMFVKYKTGFVMLLLLFILSGCGNNGNHYADNPQPPVTEAGVKETFVILQENMESENPYLSQEDMEEQLIKRLNEYIYFEGGTSYEAPFMAYEGETLDYAVFHQRQQDMEEPYKRYSVFVLLQPRDEALATSLIDFSIYNDSMYGISLQGRLDRKIDFADSADIQKGFEDLFGTLTESGKMKIWYAGTLSVGNGEEPQYTDFEGKEERVDEICAWVDVRMSEFSGNFDVFIRNFSEDDSETEVLIESKDGDVPYLLLPYYFYQDNDFQKVLELKDGEFLGYIDKIRKLAITPSVCYIK